MWWVRLLIGIAVFICIAIIGFVGQILVAKKKREDADYLDDYFKNFADFCKGNREKYGYLLEKLNRAQILLGANGIVEKLKFPFENGYHSNIPVLALINHLNDYLSGAKDNYFDAKSATALIDLIQTSFLRTSGDYEQYLQKAKRNVVNPFIDFYKGFYWLVAAPFVALSFMFTGRNIFSQNKYRILYIVFRVVAFLIQVIGLVSAIIGIAIGWEAFINLFN